MKVSFLINNAYGIGGTIRSTANLSAGLAERHEVEVVSVHRVLDEPPLALDPRVRLESLIDMRPDSPTYEGEHPLTQQPNSMFPESGVDFGRLRFTGLHDQRIADYLARTDADVVVATRPILNGYLSRYGQSHYVRVGQEHLTLHSHSDQLRDDQNAAVVGLDAFVTVSEADAADYRAALPGFADRVVCVPNGVPAPAVEMSALDSKTIIAAGRLVAVKRYDRLIDAFAKVAAERPEWTLRIYGRGPMRAALREQIDALGLYNRIFLMGPVSPIETEWSKGAIAAVSSDSESFGMTIVEAMHCGVPVVATDCPHGPGEIITHGQDGLLVPLDGGPDAYSQALLRLIADSDLRRRMGTAAQAKAATYAPAVIAARYEELFERLQRERRSRSSLATRLRTSLRALVPSSGRKDEPQPVDAERPPVPRGHAAATPDGGFVVRIDLDTIPRTKPVDFVARLRRDPERRQIRVPLEFAATGEQHATAIVERAAHQLPEGRWDCYVRVRGTKERHRVTAELVEQARLIPLAPVVGTDGVSSWIPYATSDGFLAVRTWLRPAHGEVESVVIGENEATVAVRLLGDARLADTADATARAVSREDTAHDFEVPVRVLGDDRFEFVLPYRDAMEQRGAEHDLWDLRLQLGDRTVPVGRIMGDLVERKKTDAFPPVLLDHAERGATRIKPFFTISNHLALSVRDAAGDTDA
ncbi:glycosyltransferase family 4 protein [Actinacidiphila glaucinigra]|uniref:glycosyltransferase family 4 protein n=1 Tax=Actinacidiphila glaucinigra TaxID=235986 RepID=UPI00386611FE